MRKVTCLLAAIAAAILSTCAGAEEAVDAQQEDSLHASIQHVTDSPDWVKNLPAAQDASVTQLIVVAAPSASGTTASISMHEKDEAGNWKCILSTPGYIGRGGLVPDADRVKGTGTTPQGTYHFTQAFGIADDPGCSMEYVKVNSDLYWCGDDREGMPYNQMVDIHDWPEMDTSVSEHLIDYEYQYQYCLNISFNEEGTPGRGAAIFLHCLGPVRPFTGGCVAIPENIMKQVLQHVHADCQIVIDTTENLNATL